MTLFVTVKWCSVRTFIPRMNQNKVLVNANIFFKMQRYTDSEIWAIMAQYMPSDNEGETPTHVTSGGI